MRSCCVTAQWLRRATQCALCVRHAYSFCVYGRIRVCFRCKYQIYGEILLKYSFPAAKIFTPQNWACVMNLSYKLVVLICLAHSIKCIFTLRACRWLAKLVWRYAHDAAVHGTESIDNLHATMLNYSGSGRRMSIMNNTLRVGCCH